MEMIAEELKKSPDISNKDLFEKAKSIDKGIAKLSPRQFNARYPLQVKRTLAPKKPAAPRRAARGRGRKAAGAAAAGPGGGAAGVRKGAAGGDAREKVRGVLLELARDVANAQGKGDVVDVIMGIDRYIDRVVKAAG
jgi:hypothetical protein